MDLREVAAKGVGVREAADRDKPPFAEGPGTTWLSFLSSDCIVERGALCFARSLALRGLAAITVHPRTIAVVLREGSEP
jgi:hypothetical protein